MNRSTLARSISISRCHKGHILVVEKAKIKNRSMFTLQRLSSGVVWFVITKTKSPLSHDQTFPSKAPKLLDFSPTKFQLRHWNQKCKNLDKISDIKYNLPTLLRFTAANCWCPARSDGLGGELGLTVTCLCSAKQKYNSLFYSSLCYIYWAGRNNSIKIRLYLNRLKNI